MTQQSVRPRPTLTATNEIQMYLHCRKCLEVMPEGESPQSWARTQAGFTPLGLQVWCVRHDINVVNIDFEGQTHPAEMGVAS